MSVIQTKNNITTIVTAENAVEVSFRQIYVPLALTKDDVYHYNHSKGLNEFTYYCCMPLFQLLCTCIIDAAEVIQKIVSMFHYLIIKAFEYSLCYHSDNQCNQQAVLLSVWTADMGSKQ